MKRPGDCDGSCDVCPVPAQASFDFIKEDVLFAEDGGYSDNVNKPAHYTKWSIEPITYIMRNGMEFWRGNIIKYATRAGAKAYDGMDLVDSEITDLKKVIRYSEMRINQLKGEIEL